MKRRAFLAAAAGALAAPGWSVALGARADDRNTRPPPRAEFIHLRVHSWYSRDGVPSPERIVRTAKALGFPAVALTDHGSLFGMLDFYETAQSEGIRPVLGCDLYVEHGGDVGPAAGRSSAPERLTVVAENATGYRNLLAIVSISLSARWRRPLRVTLDMLASHAAGLVALSKSGSTRRSRGARDGDDSRARALAGQYQDIFGAASYFVAVGPGDLDALAPGPASRVALARAIRAPLVASGDVHYLEPEDVLACETLLGRRRPGLLGLPCHRRLPAAGLHMRSAAEMTAAFAGVPEACRNTVAIAERCKVTLPLGVPPPPVGNVPAAGAAGDALRRLALAGLRERYGDAPRSAVTGRLARELSVVNDLGLAGQFLALRDLILDATRAGVPLTVGRGAALGSVLLHCLGVTPVDPLAFGLLFERFLDGGRSCRPDLTLECPASHRRPVLAHLAARHGDIRTVSLTNFITLGPWAALRRAARALGRESESDAMIVMAGEGARELSLDDALRHSAALREHVASDARAATLYRCAQALAGRPLHPFISTPVLFCPASSPEAWVPVYRRPRRPELVAASKRRDAARLGDPLDLVCTPARPALASAAGPAGRAARGEVEGIPLDDAETYAFLGRGQTQGIPGLEPQEARDALRALRPDRIEDVVALLALCRPNVSHILAELIAHKHRRAPSPEIPPLVARVTRDTYGVIVYQEQVMRIASEFAGFTAAEAEQFRKTLGTRTRAALQPPRLRFLSGCASRGVTPAHARTAWGLLERAPHIVLKACLVPDALLAYRVAYLRVHRALPHPVRRGPTTPRARPWRRRSPRGSRAPSA